MHFIAKLCHYTVSSSYIAYHLFLFVFNVAICVIYTFETQFDHDCTSGTCTSAPVRGSQLHDSSRSRTTTTPPFVSMLDLLGYRIDLKPLLVHVSQLLIEVVEMLKSCVPQSKIEFLLLGLMIEIYGYA